MHSYAYSLTHNYKLNLTDKITVSGISSGAFFAHQFHLIHNKLVEGAALFAGGPYYCAKGNSTLALSQCMEGKESHLIADYALEEAKKNARYKRIDSLKHLRDDKVYIFTGLNDTVVNQGVSFQLKRFYHLSGLFYKDMKFVSDMFAGHTYPTNFYGNKCSEAKKSPFISNCNYDGALESLSFLYPNKATAKNDFVSSKKGRLLKVDQSKYFSITKLELMQNEAYLYIPTSCDRGESCSLHVAFHGCSQTVDHIDELFVTKTGIMEAADKLGLVILFPQAKKAEFGAINPYGCWDWWGYSGKHYHQKKGPQVRIVKKLIEEIMN